MTAPAKVYIVQRQPSYHSRRTTVVAVLPDRAAAEEALLRADRALWPTLRHDPQSWNDAHNFSYPVALTNFDLPILLDWLRDADIPLPDDPATANGWNGWWNWICDDLTDEQLCHYFAALHKLTFHRIVEVDLVANATSDSLPAVALKRASTHPGNDAGEIDFRALGHVETEQPPAEQQGDDATEDIPY